MNPNEAAAEVKHLKGLFPTLTDDQGALMLKTFLAYDQRIVREVVERHRLTHQYAEPHQLAEGLRAAVAGRMAARIQDRANERRVADQWQSIDSLIDEMPDDELEEFKTHCLTTSPHLNDHGRAMLGKMDPRKSRTIRGLIAEAVRGPRPSSNAGAVGMVVGDFEV